MTWAPSLQKNCDFDGSGKILHQIREQIAALLAPQGNAAHTKLSGRGKFQPPAQRPHPSNPPLLQRRATSNSREPTLFCRVQKARSSWTVAIEGGSILFAA